MNAYSLLKAPIFTLEIKTCFLYVTNIEIAYKTISRMMNLNVIYHTFISGKSKLTKECVKIMKQLKLCIFYCFILNVNGKIDKNHLQVVMSNVKRKICHEDHTFITEKEITFAAILLMNVLFSADNKTYYTV